MFKNSSFEEELFESMEKQLKANQLESKKGFNRLSKAADLLNTAATIFDKVGMTKEADAITQILNSMTKAGK